MNNHSTFLFFLKKKTDILVTTTFSKYNGTLFRRELVCTVSVDYRDDFRCICKKPIEKASV